MDYSREFCTLVNNLQRKYGKWQIWNDFLLLSATSLVNSFPSEKRDSREEAYLQTIRRYTKEEQETFITLFSYVVLALEENPKQDFLGTLYHRLNLQQEQKGQFFTPYHISELMAELNFNETAKTPIENRGYLTVNDPTCGSGAMLIAFSNVCLQHHINHQQKVLFFAQDIDWTAAMMCYIQLSLLGCNAFVIIGDSLLHPGFHPDNDVFITPMLYLNQWRFPEYFT